MWQPRSGSVLDVMGHEAVGGVTPSSKSKYMAGSSASKIKGSDELEFRLIKSDLVEHVKLMLQNQCPVHLVAFGFDRHQMWLADARLRVTDGRSGGGGFAGADIMLDSQRASAAVCQVTNILECAPWNSTVAKVRTAAQSPSGSGSGFTSGETAQYTLQTWKPATFNGPEWQVGEGDRVTSGGTFKGTLATLAFDFPVGGARFNAVGEWSGTIRQLSWSGGTIQEDAKTAGVDVEITIDDQMWRLEVEVTAADEQPRMTVDFAGQSDGARIGACIDCSDPSAVAGTPFWIEDLSGPMWAVSVDDDHLYIIDADFNEQQTDLDLSAYDIIYTARDQSDGKIYLLDGSTGAIYRCDSNGDNFELAFATSFTDLERMVIDSLAGTLLVGDHTFALFNNRMYGYDTDGTPLFNWEARLGTGSYNEGPSAIGYQNGTRYAHYYRNVGLSRFRLSDGLAEGLQSASGLQHLGGNVDYENNIGFRAIGSGIYQFDPQTVNNPSNAILVAGNVPTTNANIVNFFDDNGTRVWVGCTAGRIWSWRQGAANAVQNRTTSNFKALTTRKPLGA
jgi:hypothetical protein